MGCGLRSVKKSAVGFGLRRAWLSLVELGEESDKSAKRSISGKRQEWPRGLRRQVGLLKNQIIPSTVL